MHKPNKLLRITISAVTVVYSVLLFNLDLHLDSFGKRVVAALPMIGTIALWLWDSFIWKLPIIQSLTKRPNIKGLWEVTLTPHEDSHIPPGGNRGPIKAYMEIDQSYWQVDVTLFTKESHSDLVSFFWDLRNGDDVSTLRFGYRNKPKVAVSHRSYPSEGSCTLDTRNLKPKLIAGSYFTDRYTKGDLEAKFIDGSKGHGSFESIKKHIAQKKK